MTLRDHGLRLDVRRLDLPEPRGGWVPTDLDNVHGVISMGGPQNVGESHPWMEREMAFLKAAHDANLPVIGICLGAQLIAAALGGTVEKLPQPEVGFHTVDLTIPAQTEQLLAGVPWTHMQFHSHAYGITKLPAGATLLASSAGCTVQAFKAGLRTIGFQFHPECDRAMIERFEQGAGSLSSAVGLDAGELVRQMDKHYAQYARVSNRIALNLATLCFPFSHLLAV